jgi:hypothetical protein
LNGLARPTNIKRKDAKSAKTIAKENSKDILCGFLAIVASLRFQRASMQADHSLVRSALELRRAP